MFIEDFLNGVNANLFGAVLSGLTRNTVKEEEEDEVLDTDMEDDNNYSDPKRIRVFSRSISALAGLNEPANNEEKDSESAFSKITGNVSIEKIMEPLMNNEHKEEKVVVVPSV